MCGIVGVFNKYQGGFTTEQRDVFNNLLLIDTIRGEDSTGVFCVELNGDVSLAKSTDNGAAFVSNGDVRKLMQTAFTNGACMVGHNRKATRGSVTDENAHPFVVEDKIVLVHNGGMYGDHKKHADVDVDSHAIAHLLAEDKDPAVALGKFFGAYALIWYDVEEETVKIIRNKERPLWWMETNNAWIWASEKCMLDFVAERHKLKVENSPTLLDEDKLTQYKLENRRWTVTNKTIILERPVYVPTAITYPNNYGKGYYERMYEDAGNESFGEPDTTTVPFKEVQRKPSANLDRVFLYTVGSNKWERTSAFEKALAESCNKMVTAGEFNQEIVNTYLFNKSVVCTAFEYVEDGTGGWYLYASPVDDQEVLLRHHFPKEAKVTEERIMTMALNEYAFEFKIDTKSWSPFLGTRQDDQQKGYCVITSSKAKLISGGGVVDGKKVKEANAY